MVAVVAISFFTLSVSLCLSALLKQIMAPVGDGKDGNKHRVTNCCLIIHVKSP